MRDKRFIKGISVMMAVLMLVISMDMSVNFHYCNEDHLFTSSFGDASELCMHCMGHHHPHGKHLGEGHGKHLEEGHGKHIKDAHGSHLGGFQESVVGEDDVLRFEARCCCEDFEQEICLTEGDQVEDGKLTVWVPLTKHLGQGGTVLDVVRFVEKIRVETEK